MSTIGQIYSGVFTNYRTQYIDGQVFRNTQKNTTSNVTKSSWSKTTPKVNNDTLSAVKNLVDNYNSRLYPFGSQFNQSMYTSGAYLKMNTLASIGNLFSHMI